MLTVLGEPGMSTPSSLTLTATSPGNFPVQLATKLFIPSVAGCVVTSALCAGETEIAYLAASPGSSAAGFPRLSLGVMITGSSTLAAAPSSVPKPDMDPLDIKPRTAGAGWGESVTT